MLLRLPRGGRGRVKNAALPTARCVLQPVCVSAQADGDRERRPGDRGMGGRSGHSQLGTFWLDGNW
jgi:hypothetical protein